MSVATVVGVACSTPNAKVTPPRAMPFEASSDPIEVKELWSRKLPGPLTDLSLSKDGNAILVASIPDQDTGEGRYQLTRFNRNGKEIWKVPLKSQIKSQAISADGTLAVTANYGGDLSGIDASGKTIWTAAASCKPILFNQARRILCQHDDDTVPDVAFEIFDWNGKKLSAFQSKQDLLTLKVSADETTAALAFTGGKVIVFEMVPGKNGSDFKKVREFKVKGEILDVAIAAVAPASAGNAAGVSGIPGPVASAAVKSRKAEKASDTEEEDEADRAEWQVGVLSHSLKQGQVISLFDSKGKLRATAEPGSHVEQLEMSSQGSELFVYGNSPKGQYLAVLLGLDRAASGKASSKPVTLSQKWQRSDKRYADYSSSIVASDHQVMAGFEDVEPSTRNSHLVIFDLEGKMRANLELKTEEGAYLYSYAYSPENGVLAVGTDDSKLSVFSLGK
ncbi:MAG: PQQ-binding-like beta-propeller repeat protein [Methylotenera sp.]|nr:PQQ-binding-like beta-propeller repeat protein [Oligoflexia bacterium]